MIPKLNIPAALAVVSLATLCTDSSGTTINSTNRFSYGANIGWMDWRGDGSSGVRVTDFICQGYVYAANVGWINMGGGAPTNGIQYGNLAATDFGVNVDSSGNLRGMAYGANIGWINFAPAGAPRLSLHTGRFSGWAYSANCGWISLSDAFAHVQTDVVLPGADTDGDGLPDAWELTHFGSLAASPTADSDGDGMNNAQEYLAGTLPMSVSSVLSIVSYNSDAGGVNAFLSWQSVESRCYFIEQTLSLDVPPFTWFDSGLGLISPDGATTSRTFSDTNAPQRFLRVRAVKPLSPP